MNVFHREFKDTNTLRKRTNRGLVMNRKLWAKIKKKKRYWERLRKMQGDGISRTREYSIHKCKRNTGE